MHYTRTLARTAGVLALLAACGGVFAQSGSAYKLHCHSIGYNPPQPVGDRDGHAVSVGQYTCRVEGGPWDGGVMTGSQIWDYDKTNAVSLAGSGVIRKPAAMGVFQTSEAKLAQTLADGKVTGFTGTARGTYKMASGTAAQLAGKTYSSTFRSTEPGQFIVETKVD